MTPPLDRALESALADYRTQLDRVRDTTDRMRGLEVTETAPRRTVSVTVGARGEIRKIAFPTHAYTTMAPATLATTIMDTIGKARTAVEERVAALAAPGLPGHLDPAAVARGDVDLSAFLAPGLDLTDDPSGKDRS